MPKLPHGGPSPEEEYGAHLQGIRDARLTDRAIEQRGPIPKGSVTERTGSLALQEVLARNPHFELSPLVEEGKAGEIPEVDDTDSNEAA
jgi:hypothetical protein